MLFPIMWTILATLLGGGGLSFRAWYVRREADSMNIFGLVTIFCVMFSVVPIIVMAVEHAEKVSCVGHAEEYRVDYRYSTSLGCRFETRDGRFIDSSKWRVTD